MAVKNIVSTAFETVRSIKNISLSMRPDETPGFEPLLEVYPHDHELTVKSPKRRYLYENDGYKSPIL